MFEEFHTDLNEISTGLQSEKGHVYLKWFSSKSVGTDTVNKDEKRNTKQTDASLHSKEIKENLDKINTDPWYYIYQNYVNPPSKKKMD